jgi:hypothetical protein
LLETWRKRGNYCGWLSRLQGQRKIAGL